MNYVPFWNRKPDLRTRRSRLRRSSSELAIEFAEPRLLLSATITGTQAGAAAMQIHDDVHNVLAAVMHTLEATGAEFQQTLPLISNVPGAPSTLSNLTNAAHDKFFDLEKLIEDKIVAPLAGTFNTNTTTTDLAGAFKTALEMVTGAGTVVVTDNSMEHTDNGNQILDKISFDFSVTLAPTNISALSTDFLLDLNNLIGGSGLSAPVTRGTFAVSEVLTFSTNQTFANGAAVATAHSFDNAKSVTTFEATATIHPENVSFGLLGLNVAADASLDYKGTITATFGTALTAASTAMTVAHQTDTPFDFKIELKLSDDVLQIPGFTQVVNGSGLELSAALFSTTPITVAFTGFESLKNLASMSPTDLLNVFTNIDGYINQLTQSSLLNIEFPLTNGATIGSVINFAAEFKADILDKLGSVDAAIGLDHSLQSSTAIDGMSPASVFIMPPDAQHISLPESFRIEITVNGKLVNLDITNPYLGAGNAVTKITTLGQLETAIELALPAALQAAGLPFGAMDAAVTVASANGRITFTAAASGDATNPAAISIHTPGTAFTDLVTFAKNLSSLLGYGDLITNGTLTLNELLAGIGLHFNSAASTLEFQLNYSTHIPAGLSVLGFDGSHRAATGSGTIAVTATAPTTDPTDAFAFNLVINGHKVEIDIAADPNRADLVSAITAALNKTVNRTDLGLTVASGGPTTVNLGTLVQVADVVVGADTLLRFTATESALTPDHPVASTPLLALSDVNAVSFNVGFDLGALGGLALSNGNFSFDASAGIGLTIGIKIPSASSGTTIAGTTPLDSLPIWPTGAVTADQLTNPSAVVRADIGLGADAAKGLIPSDVQLLNDFITVTDNGSVLTFTVNAAALTPVSGQSATVSLQGNGVADLGFTVGQSAADDGSHNPFTLTATRGVAPDPAGNPATPDYTKEFLFNLVINGHAVRVDIPADTAHSLSELTAAINAALGAKTGQPDLKIYLRDGTTGTIEFQTNKAIGGTEKLVVVKNGVSTDVPGTGADNKVTIDNLKSALNLISGNLTIDYVYDTPNPPHSIIQLHIIDSTTSAHLTQETLGFSANQSAAAQRLPPAQPTPMNPNPETDPSKLEYQAVLTADPVRVLTQLTAPGQPVSTTPDWTLGTDFLLAIGTLDPLKVHVDPGPRTTSTQYADALNTAMGMVSFTNAQLGLSGSGIVLLSALVHADAVDAKTLTLTLNMHNGVSAISVNSSDSVLRAEAKFGFSISTVDTLITPTNGSLLAGALGIGGFDKTGLFNNSEFDNTTHLRKPTDQGQIDSALLQGGAFSDRIYVKDASLYAGIGLHISGNLSGTLGFLGFTADATGDIFLKTSLALQNPDGGSAVTFSKISAAFTDGSLADLWAFNIGSGKAHTPWAELRIDNFHINGSTIANNFDAAIGGTAFVDIKFDGDLTSLSALLNTRPTVTYTDFSLPDLQNLSFSKIVAGIETILNLLDNTAGTNVLTTDIPLVGVNLESILHFTTSFANFVDELQSQPASALDKVTQAIQTALGTSAVSLTISAQGDLLLNFNTTPLNASTTLPLTLDLKALAAAAGVSLPDGVANLASASGTLAITAGATIGISLGIRLSPDRAGIHTKLTDLNKGAGAAGDGTSAADLRFVLGNGRSFTVDIDNIANVTNPGAPPEVFDLLAAINTAAGNANFATFSNGHFVFTDTSVAVSQVSTSTLTDLGFNSASRTGVDDISHTHITLTAAQAVQPADAEKEYTFNLVINGHAVSVDVGPQVGRDADGLVIAIQNALNDIYVDRSALNLNGSGQATLGSLVTIDNTGGKITLTAAIPDIASTTGPTSLSIHDIDSTSLVATLGLSSPAASTDTNGLSVITATSAPADYGLSYRFDVVLNGHAVTVDIAENGARTTAAAFAAAVSAAISETLVDKTDLYPTGSGKISLGQLVTVSLNNGLLSFTAFDTKLGASHSFELRTSNPHSQTVALEVIDLNNSGGAERLGLGTGSGTLDLHTLASDPATRIDTTVTDGNLSVTLTPTAGTNYGKALSFDVVIDGHPITVSVAATANRDINGLATAINAALAKLSVDRHEFGLSGTGTTTLDKVVVVTSTDTQLTLTAAASNLGALAPGVATHSLEVRDIAVTTAIQAGLSGQVAGRVFTGQDIDKQTDDDRFFVNTRAPDAMTDPGSGIVVRFGINATNLMFNTSFGPLSASIKDGTATLGTSTNGSTDAYVSATDGNGHLSNPYVVAPQARVGVGLTGDMDDRLSFTAIGDALGNSGPPLSSLFAVTSNVAIKVDLPFYLVGIPAGHVIVAVSDILGTNGGIDTYLSLPTDFADHFSAFNFLNNPQAIINGLDALLSTTDSLFQDKVFGFKLPLIGDALSSAGNFVGDLRANVIGYLQGLVDDYEALHPGQEPTTASIISDGLSSLLGSLGFVVPNGTFANVVTSKVDPVAESITFDLNIQKTLFFGSVDLSTNLGIPGLGINIQNGKIDLSLILNMSLEFGYAALGANQGFFFNDTLAGSHAVALSVLATLPTNPPAKVTANLGIITLSAENSTNFLFSDALHPRGTLLDAGVYVDLHPKSTATLFDLGFTSTTLDQTISGVNHIVTAGLLPTLAKETPITFNVSVNGTDFKVVTTPGPDIVVAINNAMAGIQVAATVVGGGANDPTITLGSLVTADLDNGHLRFTSTDAKLGGANGHLAVDDIKLKISDVPKSLRVDMQAHADLNLFLNANIDLGGSIQLPSVSTELIFEYQFAKLLTGFDDGTFTSRVLTPITFKNVTLDVGPFLTGFLKPILDIAEDVLGPIRPILDFITSPLPGISDLIGSPTSLIDLAQTFGGDNPEVRSIIAAVQVLDQVSKLVQTINHMVSAPGGGTLKINFGTYVFASGSSHDDIHFLGTNIDPLAGGTVKSTQISSSLGSVRGAQELGGGGNADAASALNQLGTLGRSTQGNGKLSLPILESPVSALKLLTGQLDGIDLFTWELPTFVVGLSGGKTFPVVGIPGIGISAGLSVNFSVGLHVKFGYDTTGLVEFLRSNNPVFLLDGFYVDNTVGPQLTAHFGIAATAALDLVLVRAGVTGEISGDFGFTLLDPNDDGRVRPVEILDTLLHDPLHIFVIDGAITASVSAWWWVGIDTYLFGTITLYEGSKTLLSGTLVSFHYAPDPVPILATLDSSGTLNIDMGPLANQRAHAGDNVDNNETFTITHNGGDQNSESVSVDYQFGSTHYTRTYTGVKAINVDGGIGNNSITLNNIQTDMTVNAGDGNNTINLNGSTGKSTIIVGDGNNIISGGEGADTITAGDGNNRIFGQGGADIIKAGAGANFVNGGTGNDQITVGGGRNAVIGGLGDNQIKAGNGNNVVIGGVATAATETRLQNAVANTDLANFGEFSTTVAPATLSAIGTTDGTNTIRLGSGNNIVFGGSGGDTITAGSGNNVVLADVGTVQVATGGAIVYAATLDDVSNPLTQGGNDFVRLGVGTAPNSGTFNLTNLPAASGTGNQIIIGGGGDDILIGTNGTNIILGDFGSVDGPGTGGQTFGIATFSAAVGGADGIVGGVGADVLFGGGNNDVINSGSGDDIVAGDDAVVVRTAAIGPNAGLVSFQSLNENSTAISWNDKIDGSTGGDLVIGGGGGDTIDGGSGNNVLLGDFGIIIPTTDNTKAPSNPTYNLPDIDPAAVYDVKGSSTGSPANGNDTITATNGYNVIMGGGNDPNAPNALNPDGSATGHPNGTDTITAGDGNNLIFGDSGWVKRQFDSDHNPIPVEAHVVDQISGGNDFITSGRGNNVVIGGAGDDQLNAGGGNNVLLGDFGTYRLPNGTVADVVGTDTGLLLPGGGNANGNDTITVAGGNTIALGGGGDDTIVANKPLALDDLLGAFNGDRIGVDNGTAFIITAAAPTSPNLGTRYTFEMVINGHEFSVDVGADTGRSKFQDLVDAITTALTKITPLKSDLGLAGNGTIKLSDIVTVSQVPNGNNTATTLTFAAKDSALTPASGTASFALRDAPSVNALFGDSGSVKRSATLDLISAETADEGSGGADTIQLNYGKNAAFGGAGNDTININGSGINVALGDNGIITTATANSPDIVLARNTGAGGADTITITTSAISNNVVLGGVGNDVISINGNGNNVTFGDSGRVERAADTLAVIKATTEDLSLDESVGDADTLTVGTTANGNNVMIGGAGQDIITIRGTGKNIALGDLGSVTTATLATPDIVTSRNVSVGDVDTITVESTATGINILIGAAGNDRITINGPGANIAFGDGGVVNRAAGTLALISAQTTEESIGGRDTILVDGTAGQLGNGNNILIGGADDDLINISGNGRNIAMGDSGIVTAATANAPEIAAARNTTTGGVDTISITATATGNNVIMGGAFGETITVDGTGDNVIFGDSGQVLRAAGTLDFISAETVEEDDGAADSITINGRGKNVVLGGAASDTITIAGIGNNVALGDFGLVRAIDGVNADIVGRSTANPNGAADTFILTAAATGNNIIMGENGDESITSAATGFNIYFGDTGSVTRNVAGQLLNVTSVEPDLGGADTITINAGSSVVIGGAKNDTIQTFDGLDYIVGDNGSFTFIDGVRSELRSTDFLVAGNDTINAGGGENYIIGGGGNDVITAGSGTDVVFGDQGKVTWTGGLVQMATSLFDGADTPGNDTLSAGNGSNYIIGGGGNDTINGGADRDQLIGDQGFVTWNLDGTRKEVSSLLDATGSAGADTISGGDGNDNIIGGLNADVLYGDAGNDIIFGDDGRVTFVNDQERMAETLDQHFGTGDILYAGPGFNFLFGGEKNNQFYANPLTDLIAIENGHIDISAGRTTTINIPPFFGDPLLTPLGRSLEQASPGDPVLQPLQFTVIRTGNEGDGGVVGVFGNGPQFDPASIITSTLLGQAKSAFNLQGFLSDSIAGTSLLNLLAIGPSSLIEAVTFGDVLDSQQDTPNDGTATADNHSAIEGVLAQAFESDGTPDAPPKYRPILIEAAPNAGTGFASPPETAAALVFDEERGLWIRDIDADAGPRLILNGVDLPMLDLSSEITMAA